MPIDWLTLGAALLAGLMGGVHCAAMCGGIATGFSAMSGRSSWLAALEPNLGRVLGYTLAGAIVGGLGHGLLSVARVDWLAWGLRAAVGLVLISVAVRMLNPRAGPGVLAGPAQRLWARVHGWEGSFLWWDPETTAPGPFSTLGSAVGVDGFSLVVVMLIGVSVALVSLVLNGYLKREGIVRRSERGTGHYLATDALESLPDLPIVAWNASREFEALPGPLAEHARLAAVLSAGATAEWAAPPQ